MKPKNEEDEKRKKRILVPLFALLVALLPIGGVGYALTADVWNTGSIIDINDGVSGDLKVNIYHDAELNHQYEGPVFDKDMSDCNIVHGTDIINGQEIVEKEVTISTITASKTVYISVVNTVDKLPNLTLRYTIKDMDDNFYSDLKFTVTLADVESQDEPVTLTNMGAPVTAGAVYKVVINADYNNDDNPAVFKINFSVTAYARDGGRVATSDGFARGRKSSIQFTHGFRHEFLRMYNEPLVESDADLSSGIRHPYPEPYPGPVDLLDLASAYDFGTHGGRGGVLEVQ